MNIIQTLEREEIARVSHGKRIPDFAPGDTLIVNVKVVEGDRTRIQAYEGVCIGRSGAGLNESFTVRKISYGEGVERVFPLYSPMIDSIEITRRGKVRRAKLYYLRARRGKKARIGEKQDFAAEMGDTPPAETAATAPPAEPLPEAEAAEAKPAEAKAKPAEAKAKPAEAKPKAKGKTKAAETKAE